LVGFGADKQIMDVKDTTGYHGIFYREERKLNKMTFNQFQKILADEIKFA
jgi:hypothetical protein